MLHFLSPADRKELLALLSERFGVEDINYMFIAAGKEKLRAFSGTLSKVELLRLGQAVRVETVGGYIARKESFGFRFGFDSTQLWGEQATQHIIDLTPDQFKLWMQGSSLALEREEGIYLIRYNRDFLGCGYSTGNKILNYVPKERYMKSHVLNQ